mmetsp:Transcript_29914/g.58688  ORF Transcript_29914/g.58688 Transcript_29914/m.58688 type:complete len:222 (+) Transcript_29914:60-725(+)
MFCVRSASPEDFFLSRSTRARRTHVYVNVCHVTKQIGMRQNCHHWSLSHLTTTLHPLSLAVSRSLNSAADRKKRAAFGRERGARRRTPSHRPSLLAWFGERERSSYEPSLSLGCHQSTASLSYRQTERRNESFVYSSQTFSLSLFSPATLTKSRNTHMQVPPSAHARTKRGRGAGRQAGPERRRLAPMRSHTHAHATHEHLIHSFIHSIMPPLPGRHPPVV